MKLADDLYTGDLLCKGVFDLLPPSIAHNYGVVRHRVGLEDVFRPVGSMLFRFDPSIDAVSFRSGDRWIAGGDIPPHPLCCGCFHPVKAKVSNVGQMTDHHLKDLDL